MAAVKCRYCDRPGTATVKLNGGKTTVRVCPMHVALARKAVKKKGAQDTVAKGNPFAKTAAKKKGGGNPFRDGARGDLASSAPISDHELLAVVDLVSSRAYPGLERKPGGPDNWVEQVGGLPSYIERIAKHLHYERGYSISRAIATAVNTVKRWARRGTVTKSGTRSLVTAKTQAQAAAAVAQWEAKKARARALPGTPRGGRRRNLSEEGMRSALDLMDPSTLAWAYAIDLALTKDGRKSYKRQGRWGHGFVPLDAKARESKAKGSPIAARRVSRLYGGGTRTTSGNTRAKPAGQVKAQGGGQERVGDIGQARRAEISDTKTSQRIKVKPGVDRRATMPWNEIPESQRTVRNGKRYVLTRYRGKQELTAWTGTASKMPAPDPARRVLRSIRAVDAERMTTAQIRRLLKTPGQTAEAKKTLNAVLRKKVAAK